MNLSPRSVLMGVCPSRRTNWSQLNSIQQSNGRKTVAYESFSIAFYVAFLQIQNVLFDTGKTKFQSRCVIPHPGPEVVYPMHHHNIDITANDVPQHYLPTACIPECDKMNQRLPALTLFSPLVAVLIRSQLNEKVFRE